MPRSSHLYHAAATYSHHKKIIHFLCMQWPFCDCPKVHTSACTSGHAKEKTSWKHKMQTTKQAAIERAFPVSWSPSIHTLWGLETAAPYLFVKHPRDFRKIETVKTTLETNCRVHAPEIANFACQFRSGTPIEPYRTRCQPIELI